MAKKAINKMDLNDMITGIETSPTYPKYNEQVLSGVLNANSKQAKQKSPESSIESEQQIGKQPEKSNEIFKCPDKKKAVPL